MDARPFFELTMLDVRDQDLEELKKFTKAAFNLDAILTTASELKYARAIKQLMAAELQEPSEEFVRFFATRVYPGKMTPAVREKFAQITRRALRQFITDQLNERLKSALGAASPVVNDAQPVPTAPVQPDASSPEPDASERPAVVTTDEEREAFYIVRAIMREVVDVRRVALRDQQTYCGVLLDDNNRRPICCLYFNGSKRALGLFDNDQRKEEKVLLEDLDAIYALAPRLKASVALYAGKG